MSRETVIALRRFTEKLAYTPVTMGAELPKRPSALPPGVDARLLSDGDRPVMPMSVDATTSAGKYPSPSGIGDDVYPGFGRGYAEIGGPLERGPLEDEPAEQSWLQKLLGNIDPRMLGGMGIGGLGAYGLARLLQSEEERKKNRFPWLSTLAGTAAGGFLLPALMNNSYVQQAGSAVGNAASGAVDSVKGMVGGKA